MGNKVLNWLLFIVLCLIWGSSFILMKGGMQVLSPYQVASLRLLSAGLVLLPFVGRAIKRIPKEKRGLVILSGFLGNFFPAYLFCVAETKIDSALAGILNALTPLFAILIGVLFFQLKIRWVQVLGILIGFAGLCMLVLAGNQISFDYFSYALLVLIATIFYGINVNMVGRYMQGMASMDIASMAFVFLLIPCLLFLYVSGYFHYPLTEEAYWKSTLASATLGVLGTALASVIFYVLIKRSGTLFASMVTYGIPFVAIGWGIREGEQVNLTQVLCLLVILAGVFMANKKKA